MASRIYIIMPFAAPQNLPWMCPIFIGTSKGLDFDCFKYLKVFELYCSLHTTIEKLGPIDLQIAHWRPMLDFVTKFEVPVSPARC